MKQFPRSVSNRESRDPRYCQRVIISAIIYGKRLDRMVDGKSSLQFQEINSVRVLLLKMVSSFLSELELPPDAILWRCQNSNLFGFLYYRIELII